MYQIINSGSSIYSTSKGGLWRTDSPRIKTPPTVLLGGSASKGIQRDLSLFLRVCWRWKLVFASCSHHNTRVTSTKKPPPNSRRQCKLISFAFEKSAHSSMGGIWIFGGREMRREREREKWRRPEQRMRRGEDGSSWRPRTQRGTGRNRKNCWHGFV